MMTRNLSGIEMVGEMRQRSVRTQQTEGALRRPRTTDQKVDHHIQPSRPSETWPGQDSEKYFDIEGKRG